MSSVSVLSRPPAPHVQNGPHTVPTGPRPGGPPGGPPGGLTHPPTHPNPLMNQQRLRPPSAQPPPNPEREKVEPKIERTEPNVLSPNPNSGKILNFRSFFSVLS